MSSAAKSGQGAVVLLSGGLDSTTVLYDTLRRDRRVYALSFDYGQRHRFELESAARVARKAGVHEHRVVTIDLRGIGHSALTADLPVPRDRDGASIGTGIPITYVPARNTIFLAHALAWSEVLNASELVLGVNHVDYSGYPDCRPEFIKAFERLARLATAAGVSGARLRVRAPLIALSKADIVRRGLELGVDFSLTHSCYDPDSSGAACGRCDACSLRLRGFRDAGQVDPARYQESAPRPDLDAVRCKG